LKNAKMFHRLK